MLSRQLILLFVLLLGTSSLDWPMALPALQQTKPVKWDIAEPVIEVSLASDLELSAELRC